MIKGVRVISVPTFVDDRGYVNQIIQASDGVLPKLERLYLVGNFGKGVIRGLHKHEEEWKCFFVLNGAAKFVLVRQKEDKSTEIDSYVLSSKKPSILIVSPKIYHGWMSLEENTIILGVSNFTIDETKRDDLRIDPYFFGDLWTVKGR